VKFIRQRLRSDEMGERGLSLIEVMVAMVLFALLSTGLIYTMIQIMSVTKDVRTRQVASNLAAEEIDRARDVLKVEELVSWTTDSGLDDPNDPQQRAGAITINGDTFHVKRNVQWVSDANSPLQCGASAANGTLRYKRVNVEVTWDGMRGSATPVRSDSVVNPRTRMNEENKGTMLVTVVDSFGAGVPNATVTLTPSAGAAARQTDAEGCAYFINVPPASYKIVVSKPGFIGDKNVLSPQEENVIVPAGASNTRVFRYDAIGRYQLTDPATTPTNLSATLIASESTRVVAVPSTRRLDVFPLSFKVIAGDSVSCPAADPAMWSVGQTATDPPSSLAPNDTESYLAVPGGGVDVPLRMGVLTVSGIPADRSIRAVSTSGSGHPACTATVTYNFAANAGQIALPFGSWTLSSVKGANVAPVTAAQISLQSYGTIAGGTVTLDPRTVTTGTP